MATTSKTTKTTKPKEVSRFRNFATVVYPESAPKNWREIISESKIPVFVSPYHDKDFNPDNTPKKPHYHVITLYDGKKSKEQAKEFFDSIGGVGCEIVKSIRGYARYLCHLDNPEKAQYNTEDVKAYGGADYVGTIGLPIDKYKSIREIVEFCSTHDIDSYSELLEFAMVNRFDWFRVLCDNGTITIKEYLKSKSWEKEHHYTRHNFTPCDSDGVITDEDQDPVMDPLETVLTPEQEESLRKEFEPIHDGYEDIPF